MTMQGSLRKNLIRRFAWLTLLIAFPVIGEGHAAEPTRGEGTLALVLSGGGARGTAHIGVLKVLEELRVVPDLIVGTSMGSIVGGLYAAGYSPDEIEAILGTIDWDDIFFDKVPRGDLTFRRKEDDTPWFIPVRLRFEGHKPYIPSGVFGGQELEFILRGLVLRATAEDDFDRLPIRYRAVAMDLATSDAVVLASGNLADAMRASMAVPGMLAPVVIDGRSLVDGGSAANLPIGIAIELGAERIIAVNISSPLDSEEKERSFFQVLTQLTDFLTAGSVRNDLKLLREGDVLIQPDLGEITFSSFDRVEEAVMIGAEAARSMADRLRRFSASPESWERFEKIHVRDDVSRLPVASTTIDYAGWVDKRVVERRIDVPAGRPLDQDRLKTELRRLRGLEYFGPMSYDLEVEDQTTDLGIEIKPKRGGRTNLQFGGSLRTDFTGDSSYALLMRHQWLAVNRRAAEWVNTLQVGQYSLIRSEFLQPLDWGLRWYVKPALTLDRLSQPIWAAGARVTEYRVDEQEAAVDIGRFLGNWGNLFAAFYRGRQEGTLQIGLPLFPNFEDDVGGIRLGFEIDSRDVAQFPRRGTVLRTYLQRDLEEFGASEYGTAASLRWRQSISVGRGTLTPGVEATSNLSGRFTFATSAFLGGFQRLSGLGDNELIGKRGGVVTLDYYFELVKLNLAALNTRLFGGLTLEAGNTYFQDDPITWRSLRTGAALYVGASTPIGPIYLGGGWTDPDRKRIYLLIGSQY